MWKSQTDKLKIEVEIEKWDRFTNNDNVIRKHRKAPKFLKKEHRTPHHKDVRPNDKCYYLTRVIFKPGWNMPAEVKQSNHASV